MIHHQTSRIFPGTLAPPQMLFAEQKDKYADKTTYRDTCLPERKKSGFLTSDFPRRDEFSNTIRTAQLREVVDRPSLLALTELLGEIIALPERHPHLTDPGSLVPEDAAGSDPDSGDVDAGA